MYLPIAYKTMLYWLLMAGVMLFGIYISWDLQVLQTILQQDKTRISLLIILMLLVMSVHCARRSYFLARQFLMFDHFHQQFKRGTHPGISQPYSEGRSLSQDYFAGLLKSHSANHENENALLAELLAEGARGSHQVGWFITGLMVKLGLLGTVVGFVIMLSSISGLENLDLSDIKQLMQQMTQGMGIAMNTTMTGLVCSMLLGAQYLLLDRMADRLIAETVNLGHRFGDQRAANG
ncbi:MotA/TolQ/ExbB proton channel family protein [Pontibacter sp. JAM-7]|uniref:MotA/TolQ/ExbB proton channel family protein n=1 Tax=Pontibacter sp. JAM-7 TaxID=3366581 RepID=UPI003AF61B9D